jgi:hypothetical protein
MKTTIFILFSLILIAYAGKLTISFSPFKISMATPFEALGMFFLAISLGCFRYQAQNDGFKKGVEKSIEVIRNYSKDSDS